MDNQEKQVSKWDIFKKEIETAYNSFHQKEKDRYESSFTEWANIGEGFLKQVPKLADNPWFTNFINSFMPVSHDFRKNANSLNVALNQTIYDLNAKLKNKDVIINNQVIMYSEADKKIKSLEAEIAKLKSQNKDIDLNPYDVSTGKKILSFQDKKDEKKFDAMLFDLEEIK